MREKIRDRERLKHMLECIDVLTEARSRLSLETIQADRIIYHGLVKEIEIIGEAAYMLTIEFKESHPEVPWKEIIDMRHVLVHGYYKINPAQLWHTLQHDIEELRPFIKKYIAETTPDETAISKNSTP